MKITKSILFLIFAFLIVGFVSSPSVGLETDTIEESNLLFCSPFYNPFCYSFYEDYYLAMEALHIDLIKNELEFVEFDPANNFYPEAYYKAEASAGFWIWIADPTQDSSGFWIADPTQALPGFWRTDPINGSREWIIYPPHPYIDLFY